MAHQRTTQGPPLRHINDIMLTYNTYKHNTTIQNTTAISCIHSYSKSQTRIASAEQQTHTENMAASSSAAAGAPPKEYMLDVTNLRPGSIHEDKLPLMERLMTHVLRSDAETEDFSIPMCVPEVWDALTRPGNAVRGFNMEFYSDQLDEPDCPIPARRSGKSIANAIRNCDYMYKLTYMFT
jgi:hypothetical protein